MKSNLKYSALTILIGSLIGAGAGFSYIEHESNKLEKEHIENMKSKKARITSFKESVAQANKEYSERKKQTYPTYVAVWTLSLQRMPASQARTDFSDAVVKATQDNIITDEEYLKLESDYEALEVTNEINELKEVLYKLGDVDIPPK